MLCGPGGRSGRRLGSFVEPAVTQDEGLLQACWFWQSPLLQHRTMQGRCERSPLATQSGLPQRLEIRAQSAYLRAGAGYVRLLPAMNAHARLSPRSLVSKRLPQGVATRQLLWSSASCAFARRVGQDSFAKT